MGTLGSGDDASLLTWMRSSCDKPVGASRQLETIFSGNRECWAEGAPESKTEGPGWGSGCPIAQSPSPTHTHPHTHWGALEQFILGEVLPEDKAAVSADGPRGLYLHHGLMVLQDPLWRRGQRAGVSGDRRTSGMSRLLLSPRCEAGPPGPGSPLHPDSPSARWGWHSTSPQFSSLRA